MRLESLHSRGLLPWRMVAAMKGAESNQRLGFQGERGGYLVTFDISGTRTGDVLYTQTLGLIGRTVPMPAN